jgi:hypothetical protein
MQLRLSVIDFCRAHITQTTIDQIEHVFGACGKITDIHISKKGFGFIEFEDVKVARLSRLM